MFFIMVVFTGAKFVIAGLAGVYGWITDWHILCAEPFIYLLCIVAYLYVTKEPAASVLPYKNLSVINVLLIVFMTITLRPMAEFLSAVSSLFVENTLFEQVKALYSLPYPVLILLLCVMPAVCEEVTLRGVVLSNYSNVDIKKAALVNGFFFGLFHFNLSQFPYAFLLGFFMAYFVRLTGSILAPMLSHFIFNFISVFTQYRYFLADPETYGVTTLTGNELTLAYGYLFINALMFLPVFGFLFTIFIQYNTANKTHVLPDNSEPHKSPRAITWSFWACVGLFVLYAALIYAA
ncbi:MAG: CPBP family intramembrane metalloprotease [Clostridiales bacterium]|nr:CPBP family intramembrane metalloprotease [Clostridiales bacterium]